MSPPVKKSALSLLVKRGRQRLKRGVAFCLSALFRSKSFPLFGIATGLIDHETDGSLTLENATALSFGGVLTPKGKLNTCYLFMPDEKSHSEHPVFEASFKRFFPKIIHSSRPVVSLAAHWQNAFYHWLYEVLPQLQWVKSTDLLFISTQERFQQESLQLMGFHDQILPTQHCDAISAPHITLFPAPKFPNSQSVNYLRSKFLPHLKKGAKKRLYLSRNDATRRRIVNEAEVVQHLTPYGFEKVLTAHLPFKEQMQLFADAEIIIAPHGAGLSHLAFCDPGTKVLELFSPTYLHPCYRHLASAAQLHYHHLLGEEYADPRSPHDPDILIDLQKFKGAIDAVL